MTRPNKRQQAKASTRVRVLAGAAALFRAGGYTDTTMRGIAKAIGMSTGAIFATVQDKADLWREAIGGPEPDPALAEQIALIQADHPDAIWGVTGDAKGARATIVMVDASAAADGATAAEALSKARALADRVIAARQRQGEAA